MTVEYPPRSIADYEGHAQSCSGEGILVPTLAARQQILRGAMRPRGISGLASIQVHVEDAAPHVDLTVVEPNMRLVLDVTWRSGRGGGSATVDCARGGCFTLGGADEITAFARVELQNTQGPFVAGSAKRISISVGWGGSISPRAARLTGTSQRLFAPAPNLTSSFIPIPSQASDVLILSDTPAMNPSMLLELYSSRTIGPRTIYQDLDPTTDWNPIVHGAEFIRVIATGTVIFTPCWQLWL